MTDAQPSKPDDLGELVIPEEPKVESPFEGFSILPAAGPALLNLEERPVGLERLTRLIEYLTMPRDELSKFVALVYTDAGIVRNTQLVVVDRAILERQSGLYLGFTPMTASREVKVHGVAFLDNTGRVALTIKADVVLSTGENLCPVFNSYTGS